VKKYEIHVNATENKSDDTSFTAHYGHEFDVVDYNTIETAREDARKLDPKDFVSALLTDFNGVSGRIEIEVVTYEVEMGNYK
jgi:hypothetical protein